jgi:hypothetical protein
LVASARTPAFAELFSQVRICFVVFAFTSFLCFCLISLFQLFSLLYYFWFLLGFSYITRLDRCRVSHRLAAAHPAGPHLTLLVWNLAPIRKAGMSEIWPIRRMHKTVTLYGKVAAGGQGPSCDDSSEGTNTDVETVEEGEEGETAGPVPAAARGQPDLTLVSYRLGRSRVTEAELDKYVKRGILKSSHHGLCRAPGREEVPRPEPYEAVVFRDFFKARLRFPVKILWAKFCSASTCRFIT